MEKHAFVICAYKESEYLEECIRSLLEQTEKTPIYMASSTPCEFIDSLSEKYGIKCFYRDGESDIKDDWNYACSIADAEWVTVAHQDDVYSPDYAKKLHELLKKRDDAIMAFTDYRPLINGKVTSNVNSRIRHMLRAAMKSKKMSYSKFWKKVILAFGNSICCPTVSYNKSIIDGDVFTSEMKFNIDWDTFLKYADSDMGFVYVDEPLVYYRIHREATTVLCMDNSLRIKEDTEMFSKFWPMWLVKVIMLFYKRAYDEYRN